MQAISASYRSTGRWLLVLFILLASIASVRADFRQSEQWFGSLDDEQRLTIQTNLTLAGFYDALIDGAFGPSTYRALVKFQNWRGELQTGTLDSASQGALSRAADSVVADLDLQVLQDERALIEIAVPRALLPETMGTTLGTAYTRPDGAMRLDTIRKPQAELSFGQYFESFARDTLRRTVTYKTLREGYFVVSGAMDGGYFYALMLEDGDDSTGFILNWSPPYQKQGSIVSLFLASFASPLQPSEISPPSIVAEPDPVPAPVPTQAKPATSEGESTAIGNFLLFRDLPGVIGLRGEIGPSTPLDFRRAVRAVDDPKILILASEGGYVSSALLLAYAVRETGLATYVLPETGCYSACSFVFFAGAQRRADGALGVHQVWGDDTNASTAQEVVSDILEAFVVFGVRQEITSAMLRTKPEDMYIFSKDEIASWGINSGDPMSLVRNDTTVTKGGSSEPEAQAIEGPASGKGPRAMPENAAAYVQLASQRSAGDAQRAVVAIRDRYGAVLPVDNLEIHKVDLGERGVYFRILLPVDSRSEAAAICVSVKAVGGDCLLL